MEIKTQYQYFFYKNLELQYLNKSHVEICIVKVLQDNRTLYHRYLCNTNSSNCSPLSTKQIAHMTTEMPKWIMAAYRVPAGTLL